VVMHHLFRRHIDCAFFVPKASSPERCTFPGAAQVLARCRAMSDASRDSLQPAPKDIPHVHSAVGTCGTMPRPGEGR
jgi:hypothetical protein